MTGNYYPELASLNVDGFKTTKPSAVNALLKEAENRNLSLLQADSSQDLAREQIRQAQDRASADLVQTSWRINNSYSGSKTPRTDIGQEPSGATCRCVGRDGELRIKQARPRLCRPATTESAHQRRCATVRLLFYRVNASISSINAYKQAVVSASSLDAMKPVIQ